MRSADEPQFTIAPNAGRPGLVLVAIGTGMGRGYSITPERAEQLAAELVDAARSARGGDAA